MTIQELLEEYRIEYREAGSHHHARTGWIQIDCPFCGEGSGGFHLGINLDNQYTNCWRCGPLHLGEALATATRLDIRRLYSLLDKPVHRPSDPSKGSRTSDILTVPKGLEALSLPYKRYLIKRGFNPYEIERLWEIESTGMCGRLPWRIYIPIIFNGETVSWTTRAIGSVTKKAKYMSAKPEEEIVEHKHLLYGEDYARHSIVVVEGPIDVWAIGPGAVAIMGLNYSQEQVTRIAKYPIRTICFDKGIEAQSVAQRLAGELSCLPGETHSVELESGSDPAEASKKEIKELRNGFLL